MVLGTLQACPEVIAVLPVGHTKGHALEELS